MRVIFTEGSLDFDNKGVNAITKGAITAILACSENKNIEFVVFRLRKQGGIFVHDVNIGAKKIKVKEIWCEYRRVYIVSLLAFLLSWMPRWIKRQLLSKLIYLREFGFADQILDISAGDSCSDIYGVKHFFNMILTRYICRICEIKYIVLPQTLGPFKNGIVKIAAGYILAGASRVFVREKESYNHMKALYGDAINIALAADMAFLLEPEKHLDNTIEKFMSSFSEVVGININGFLYDGMKSNSDILGRQTKYIDAVMSVLQYFLSKTSVGILFVAHVNEDYPVLDKVFNELDKQYPHRICLLPKEFNEGQLKYYISRCSFFVGSRMHACIAAISSCVPAVPIGYSYKFDGIMDTVGLRECAISLQSEKGDVSAKVLGFYLNKDQLKTILIRSVPIVKKTVLECISSIKW